MSETLPQLNYDDMLKAGMHFGRKKTVFNPNMGKYVFVIKEGISIIDLLKTQVEVSKTAEYLKKIIGDGGSVLFVGLTKQSIDSIKDLADALKMPYVINRWLGGTLTNFKIISGRVKMMEDMEKKQTSGELDKYTKKERLMFERELKKMQERFGGLRKLTKLPDVVFVSSLKESALPVREAIITKVPIVAIANTDSNPNQVQYVIPANDRSKKSVDLIINVLKTELVK
ncbi:MAG: 30S ribosomal protein S2 [Candidatus Yanofskybacteria bacterium RIFCSPHIGHO2_01_FULL_39_8b]|uniref:Small ribosomal subunit protein uS2 n=1 Tax=Candidatus Yanofskybacteria bacterium RIFCSPHIGHO2_01_FULL_39_8b TaxID=1802659 RepID=A0A1F8EE45_9BACT|nr:MAG: 30S ribosomal protein S2 [Candidatus Yanofskybacteria bacterium RIFCSPHIGHO2_01_FULL_39_8b]